MSAQTPSSIATGNRNPICGLVGAILGCGVWVVVWWMISAGGDQVPRPFAGWDMALVSTICWTPVGGILADVLLRKSRWLMGILAAGALIASALFAEPISSNSNPFFTRMIIGAIVGISTVVLARSFERSSRSGRLPVWSLSSLVLVVPLIVTVVSAYTAERIRYYEKKFGQDRGQYRLMEARRQIARLEVLDPRRTFENRSMSMLAEDLDEELAAIRENVAQLRKALANPSFTPQEQKLRIELAQKLAILGQLDEAADELTRLTARNPDPFALNLLGTIWEHQKAWEKSLGYYEQARDVLLEQSVQPAQQAELVAAWKGIAYTQRKRGHYREAEAAYEKLLELAPTAAHHFLMAQFYEDAQQGDKAQFHAYKAAELNPRSYRDQADQLVNGMLGEQFGCWSIFRNRRI